MTPALLAAPAIVGVLAVATLTDLRRRRVSVWLTVGGAGLGVLISATSGWTAIQSSLIGLVVGGAVLWPFVLRGGFGGGDALLLAFIGAWRGWQFVLWTAWWAALIGLVLAVVAWRRGQSTFAYAPAIAGGVLLAAGS